MLTPVAAATLIKATLITTPLACLCPSCGTAPSHVYDSGNLGLCDGCIDVLLDVAELPGRVIARLRDDSDDADDIDEAAEDDDSPLNLTDHADDADDNDHEPLAETSPSHASLKTIDLHTTDGFEICEHCGAATKHHCSAEHVVCLGCMAVHSGCPLCIEAEADGEQEDLSYLDC